MIKTIIFDIGGVLALDIWEHVFLDAQVGIADSYQLSHEEVRSFAGQLWEQFAYQTASSEEELKILERDYWQKMISRFSLPGSLEDLRDCVDHYIKPIDGMAALVAQLKAADFELAICSNNVEFWFNRQKKKLPLLSHFDSNKIILSSRIGFPKASPKFEMFRAVMANINQQKDECLFIDDRLANIQNALKFGFAALLFPHEASYGAAYLRKLLENMGLIDFSK